MSRDLLIAVSPGELWAALVAEEGLDALRVLRLGAPGQPGEILLGRVVALKPELPAALVEIGLERPGFLSAEDALPRGSLGGLTEGQSVLVQIAKAARADKAAGLSMRLRLAGRLLDLVPARAGVTGAKRIDAAERARLTALVEKMARPGEGFALHAAAAGADEAALASEMAALRARWLAVEAAQRSARPPARLETAAPPLIELLAEAVSAAPDRIVIDDRAAFAEARRWLGLNAPALAERLVLHAEPTPLFEQWGIAGEVAEVLQPRVDLAEGGALTIEPTAAAVLIDVDSGGGAGRGKHAAAAALATNLAASRAVARQIRLRNLAGPIVIDFVGIVRREDRARVREALAAALEDDPDTEVLGWTRLGHLELVRKRRRASLIELLYERAPGGGWVKTPVTVALEALRSLSREAAGRPARAPSLELHPEVAAALDGEARLARAELEARLGCRIAVIAAPGNPRDRFDIRLG